MIGLVLVTHGRLAEEFIAALEHVTGKQERIAAVCIFPDDDMDERRKAILDAIAQVSPPAGSAEGTSGVILLTDMFGGTPSNLAMSILETDTIDVIAGLNLPMLIRCASDREKGIPFQEMVLSAQEAGKKYINVASRLLAQNK
ncbi:PTS sugar transporter subunit IIA [Phaeovibrio sulfidiphilus]|uniref:PTS sugar transporter subunit IIA n=1 Tax=Phaeovibrio sulfidiphilus TaxID=1220600 RepID=A0A8J6YN99_9PROT|nr:PTS sugar transporter subunit IIA [Phaeovibrio sulfidiphilus]MBE1236461.1 PTS sugar transporter subunit IIA [Phaeovibrio sulfidiphilus]